MSKVRYIQCSNDSGTDETITFTDDFECPAADYVRLGQEVQTDVVLDIDLPSGFPLEHTLRRE